MRRKSARWFVTKARVTRLREGREKTVSETYLVEAFTFTEAEARATGALRELAGPGFSIVDEKIAPYIEVIMGESGDDDKYYLARLQFADTDERGKETRSSSCCLVQASELDKARVYIDEAMAGSMADYTIAGINETPIIDVIERDVKEGER